MTTRLTIEARFCGPPDSGNGGYAAGRVAASLHLGPDEAVEVTLRAPVPLERELDLDVDLDDVDDLGRARSARLSDHETTIATARIVNFAFDSHLPLSFAEADRLASESPMARGLEVHPFPTCFVCGPGRAVEDGLRLFPARVPGTPDYTVAWAVCDHGPEFVWAALDCPSSFPMYLAEDPFEGPCVLGRITARVERVPEVGERTVIVSWRESVDGRKMHSASAMFDEANRRIGAARATWIQVRRR